MELAARTMRMNLHTLSKLGFILTFAVFLVLFMLTVVIGIVGPKPWVYFPPLSDTSTMPSDGYWTTGLNVTKLNQRVNVYAALLNKAPPSVEKANYQFRFQSSVSGLKKNSNEYSLIKLNEDNRDVTCYKGETFCESTVVVNVPYIDYQSYAFNLTMLDAMGKGFTEVRYYFAVMNSSFTQFELWFRFFFLLTTVAVIIVYAVKLRGFEWKDWAIEQRWVAFLLFGLLGYNNPAFPLTILLDGAFWPFLDQVMLASFLVLLMFFWIIMFDGIRTEPQLQTFRTFYLPKFIMLALFWIAAVVIFTWTELAQIRDPGADVYKKPAFLAFYVIMVLLLVIYLFWLSYVVFRAISSRNAMPYLSLRLKFFGIFTLLVLIVVIAGVIGGAIGPISNNAAQLLSFISLLNLYVYTLAFVYFPSKDVIGRAKNSGMVAIQDLDESVAEMEEHPTHSHSSSAHTSGGFGGSSSNTGISSGGLSNAPSYTSSSTPAWRQDAPAPAPTHGPAPIRINFDDLGDDEEDAHL